MTYIDGTPASIVLFYQRDIHKHFRPPPEHDVIYRSRFSIKVFDILNAPKYSLSILQVTYSTATALIMQTSLRLVRFSISFVNKQSLCLLKLSTMLKCNSSRGSSSSWCSQRCSAIRRRTISGHLNALDVTRFVHRRNPFILHAF